MEVGVGTSAAVWPLMALKSLFAVTQENTTRNEPKSNEDNIVLIFGKG